MPNKKLPPELLNEIIDCFRVEHGWFGALDSTQTLQNFLLCRLNKWAELGLFSLFDAIRLVFRKGRNMGLFTKGYLDQMLLIERAVVNLRNSYKVTVVNNAIWVVIYEECRLVHPELARFILNLEGLLNMDAFQARPANQPEVAAQREVSAPRRSLPFARISHGLSISPVTQREVAAHREVSARRNFPSGIISSVFSVPRPPPPRVKPPLPPVHNEPNYMGGHQASFGQNQSDYASIDDQQQMALPPAKEIIVRLAVDDPVSAGQTSSQNAPQDAPRKLAWKFRSKNKQQKKKEEQQQKKEKPKWKF
ncbi:hypothetical protein niasHS_014209 [Heterodera schachtii]|uniref:Uncharacterized protein n=1 Tax=Heterodera schachtii TaxID=97005 RepID=A0ABD2I2N5_HETSC